MITGCWFSRHSSLGLRTVRIEASWPSGTKPTPAAVARLAPPVGGGGRRQADRQQGQTVAVEPDRVRIADADVRDAVLLRQRAGHLAVERRVELGLHVHRGQADAGGLDAVGPDDDVGLPR